jgi:hypothetical protein
LLCQKWLAALTSAETRAAFHWDDALCAGAVAEIEPFEHAAAACDKDDSTKNRAARRETRQKAIEAMRAFAASSIRNNPYMSEADRLELGLNRPDSIPTVHERPALRPTAAVERTINFCEHRVKALNPENGKPVKPAGVYGVRFVWQLGGERPATGAAILNGKFSRRPVFTVAYDETDRGKTAYYASCYENSKGEAGPWSPVVEAYIG